ncbi:MAG: replication-associated recombination protein A [Magnetococcales bacterium]|nr:replication-associated recombination protein A [Magnetococcales bacterium]
MAGGGPARAVSRSLRPPLADRMRPTRLDDMVGQESLTGPGGFLAAALAAEALPSMILWGPPGCGKTTLARVVAGRTRHHFEAFSAVFSGVKDLRGVVERARAVRAAEGRPTLLFVDEIHRFNKSQQDGFLPFVEDGTVVLIGATTENPSFELNNALLSRCRVVVLEPLAEPALLVLLQRAMADGERGLGRPDLTLEEGVLPAIAAQSGGDARHALNLLEAAVAGLAAGETILTRTALQRSLATRAALFDRDGEGHYNLISALHKSLRGSDPDAALYWLARILAGGEDGLYVARRMIRFATEDVGNADPQALALAIQARDAYHFLGPPEGELALAQAAVYLATAPKSNSVYTAWQQARQCAAGSGSLMPPRHILNAPTALMKELGYGAGYRYAHDYEGGYVAQEYLPEPLRGRRFYQPVERGFEREIARRLAWWRRLKEQEQPQ